MIDFNNDNRIVLTLDAGGTNLEFSAIKGLKEIVKPIRISSEGANLEKCLNNIKQGFKNIISQLDEKPSAISFAFPGPADYSLGIIGDLKNLPGFKGGIPLKDILEEEFDIPVFINNDGDLFVYGEAICGFLPYINNMLKENNSPKRYKNLFGVTLGTGFGGGLVSNNTLYKGDNSLGTEVWLMSRANDNSINIEEDLSIRAIVRDYSELSNDFSLHTPKSIYNIAKGNEPGNMYAANKAYEQFGEKLGHILANIATLTDSLIVIGGGLSKASELFFAPMIKAMKGCYYIDANNKYPKLVQKVFNIEEEKDTKKFLKGDIKSIKTPAGKVINYDPMSRIGIGTTKLGTEKAVSIGAYVYALNNL